MSAYEGIYAGRRRRPADRCTWPRFVLFPRLSRLHRTLR